MLVTNKYPVLHVQTPPEALIFASVQLKQLVEVVMQVAQNPVQIKQLFPFR